MQQLFLKIDRVRGNDCLFVVLERKQDCRCKISQRFAHACSRFDDQMAFFFQRLCHGRRHFLLLGSELKVPGFRQRPAFRKKSVDSLHKFAAYDIFQRNHDSQARMTKHE